ncbi:hypothetical protein EPA93_08625 [Ktedonosporobacter rubrisoli]|uniref:Bacteriocin n=1 Tax=Ktedonosporobacter rubrisoli TaxID=2509675 RepID=A0A4P6JMY9_KTERU|nr:hypothetical protein [Ktedonosporobacter rubrisoli]QBD76066.1 hypothetical protein EPA93_08625 [Ktedonosporobacter rubrisoli]
MEIKHMFELNEQELKLVAGGKKKYSHKRNVKANSSAKFGGKGVGYANNGIDEDGNITSEGLSVGTKNGNASSSLSFSDSTEVSE